MSDQRLVFSQGRSYFLKKELGQGACGKTVLLYDEIIDEYFVCKKYSPMLDEWKQALFKGFVGEIKLLHGVHHINVVRVFNYVLHPDKYVGYIFLEYVEGSDIEEYAKCNPESLNEVFVQVVEGFAHLESKRILHRDIRPSNVMVTKEGVVKIIDFGFGKKALESVDFEKSISLNWWCELPPEFSQSKYDFSTEVYFIGKLFKKLIDENTIRTFRYLALLGRMIEQSTKSRISSFANVRDIALAETAASIDFTDAEREVYQEFSANLVSVVTKIEADAEIFEAEDFIVRLERVYRGIMLEEYIFSCSDLIGCFVNGSFYYKRNASIRTEVLRSFLELLKASVKEKRNIIEANIHARLKSVSRYEPRPKINNSDAFDDDIPF
ncbi:protein kinase family protein [Pseudomonas capsici]|uniref:protein kinase family protein n=1 Tax=Pseudomonas capsici TaxID=2810614 RepID=UPI0021F182F8|nr:protein kinase family protein [Pseudomonas capsici]MCV4340491.1 protein kinase family protein [Pseudomonas capsici]